MYEKSIYESVDAANIIAPKMMATSISKILFDILKKLSFSSEILISSSFGHYVGEIIKSEHEKYSIYQY